MNYNKREIVMTEIQKIHAEVKFFEGPVKAEGDYLEKAKGNDEIEERVYNGSVGGRQFIVIVPKEECPKRSMAKKVAEAVKKALSTEKESNKNNLKVRVYEFFLDSSNGKVLAVHLKALISDPESRSA